MNTALRSRVNYRQRGFTIIELLIVIVVIAILAAITIVAYNGIQQRAHASAAQSALTQASKKLALYQVDHTAYPVDSATFFSTLGVDVSGSAGGVSYQYSVDNGLNPPTYCITATAGNVSYKVTESTSPTSGGCPGHGTYGQPAITNLHTNPSVEANQNGYKAVNGAVLTRQTASAIDGMSGLRVAAPAGGITDSGISLGIPTPVVAGQPRTYMVKIRAVTSETYKLSLQNTGGSGSTRQLLSLSAGQTGTIRYTWTPRTSGPISGYLLRSVAANPSTFDVDSVMVVDGTYTGGFADGNSSGWVWNGTPNNSTSTGPAQ